MGLLLLTLAQQSAWAFERIRGVSMLSHVVEPRRQELPSHEAVLVAEDLAARGGPSRLKTATQAPSRTRITYPGPRRSYAADLYRPANPPRAGLVLIPGAEQQGIENPMIVSLATTLARARFTVLVPALPGLSELKVRPGDVAEIGTAFCYALSRPRLFPKGHTGLASISYSVGPTVMAAMQPRIRARVGFILGIGGYYDLREVITFFTTGWYEVEGTWRHMEPHPYGKWVFAQSMADRLSRETDRQAFRAMVQRKLEDPESSLEDLAARLGPEGQALYELITNRERERVAQLISRLPAGILQDLAALNLARRDLSPLAAEVLLIHSREDDIIPYSQSSALHRALPRGQSHLFLASFGHVEFWKLDRADLPAVLRAIDRLLAKRSPAAAG